MGSESGSGLESPSLASSEKSEAVPKRKMSSSSPAWQEEALRVCRLLPTAYCLLPTADYPTAYCLLPTTYCLLPTAYCLLPTAYCLLPTAYCLLPTT